MVDREDVPWFYEELKLTEEDKEKTCATPLLRNSRRSLDHNNQRESDSCSPEVSPERKNSGLPKDSFFKIEQQEQELYDEEEDSPEGERLKHGRTMQVGGDHVVHTFEHESTQEAQYSQEPNQIAICIIRVAIGKEIRPEQPVYFKGVDYRKKLRGKKLLNEGDLKAIETAVKHGAHSVVFSAIEGTDDIEEARDALKKVKGHHVSLIAKI